jgi:Arc/MetJ family transcription regulator
MYYPGSTHESGNDAHYIDDDLLSPAMAASGLTTRRATVEESLRLLIRIGRQVKAVADLKD